jgi:hypothetical protein
MGGPPMSCFIIEQKGIHQYIVESTSYYDSITKKPRSKKLYIGKIDQLTGNIILKEAFNNKITGNSLIIKNKEYQVSKLVHDIPNIIKLKNDINTQEVDNNDLNTGKIDFNSVILPPGLSIDNIDQKIYGPTYLLYELAKKCHLIDILQEIFPKYWSFIINLIFFIILENKSPSHYKFWAEHYHVFPAQDMSSQRISDLFINITHSERMAFYKKWTIISKEDEFIALDITSIPSYSENIDEVDFGRKKSDNTRLPQVNICMLFGEDSYLPMYQTTYNGSLTDVVTLKSTLQELNYIFGSLNIKLVLDRCFYSKENINYMLSQNGLKFIIGVPFTSNYSKKIILSVENTINNVDNYIKTSTNGDYIKGLKVYIQWNNGDVSIYNQENTDILENKNILTAYITYNPKKYLRAEKVFLEKLNLVKEDLLNSTKIALKKHKNFIEKFLIVVFTEKKR